MIRRTRQRVIWCGALAALLVFAGRSGAELVSVTGSSTARVSQYSGATEIQRDLNQASAPGTSEAPPLVTRARLDRLATGGETTAAGQVVSILYDPSISTNPSDVGLDLGAFSDDNFSRWVVEGTATETRRIIVRSSDLGGTGLTGGTNFTGGLETLFLGASENFTRGSEVTLEGTILLSGIMVMTGDTADSDLSGVDVRFRFSVVKRPVSTAVSGSETNDVASGDEELVAGALSMVGSASGGVELAEVTGAMTDVTLTIVELPDVLPDLPVVRAIPFDGVRIPYEYTVTVGEAFELELSVNARLNAMPGGTGAAAVFGTPDEGLAAILSRVKQDDLGSRLSKAIADRVDTTGQAYVDTPSSPFPFFPLCGVMGLESAGLLGAACMLRLLGRSRRRRRVVKMCNEVRV